MFDECQQAINSQIFEKLQCAMPGSAKIPIL